jgi:prepilin-type processing-associated H-X9-DG protein
VVLGVIALLGVLFSVAIQLGIGKARSAACISNLRQIYGALQQYASDNDGQLPIMLPLRASLHDPGPTLDTALTTYLADPKVFHCPADPALFAQSGCSYLWIYGMSVNASGQPNGSMIHPTFPLLQNANLPQIPFVSDKESFHATTPGAHIVYADGHVE